jgi:threonine/homoserine/homoserine lactone efflux protein
MTYASQVGFGKSYVFNIGLFIGRFTTALMCALCTGLLYVYIPKIQFFMKTAGALYMLFLAWKTLRNTASIHAKEIRFNAASGIASGVALQFVNPKAWIVGINVMSSYVLPYYKEMVPVIGFAALFSLVSCSGNICWGLFGTLFRKLFINHGKIIHIAMACLLAYCAASLFIRA